MQTLEERYVAMNRGRVMFYAEKNIAMMVPLPNQLHVSQILAAGGGIQ